LLQVADGGLFDVAVFLVEKYSPRVLAARRNPFRRPNVAPGLGLGPGGFRHVESAVESGVGPTTPRAQRDSGGLDLQRSVIDIAPFEQDLVTRVEVFSDNSLYGSPSIRRGKSRARVLSVGGIDVICFRSHLGPLSAIDRSIR
jgi:hypothetical protein